VANIFGYDNIGNAEKDSEKQFEGSYVRVISVMCITYAVVLSYFYIIGVNKPYLNAVVPTLGFNLSTWSLAYIRYLYNHKTLCGVK